MPDKVEPDSIGARVKELRTKAGFSRAKLGKLAGRSTEAIWMLENGKIKNPKLDTIMAIAKALKIPAAALL